MALFVPAMFVIAGLFCCVNVVYSASALSGNGAGTYVGKNSTFNFGTGSISGFNTTGLGGGVFVDADGTFNMTGGTISGNTAMKGGGVYVSTNGTFTLNSGEISGNTATEGSGENIYNGGTFVMNGGTVGKSGSPALFYNFYNTTTKLYGGNFYENIYSYSDIEAKVEANITGQIEFVETGILTVENYAGTTPKYTVRVVDTRGEGAIIVFKGGSSVAPDLSKISISGYDTNRYVVSCEKDSNNVWTVGLSRRVTNVTFNPNGGSCNSVSKNVYYGDTYGDLPSASKAGYTFAGWSRNYFDVENGILRMYQCQRNGTTFTFDTGTQNTKEEGMHFEVQGCVGSQEYVKGLYASWSSQTAISFTFTKDSSYNVLKVKLNGNASDGEMYIDISRLTDGETYVFQAYIEEMSMNHMVVSDIMIEQNAGNVATTYTNDVVSSSSVNNNLYNHTLFARWNPIYIDVNIKNLSGAGYEGSVMGNSSGVYTGRYKIGDVVTISYSPNGNFVFSMVCKGTSYTGANYAGSTYIVTAEDIANGSVDFRICYNYSINVYSMTNGNQSGAGGYVWCYDGQTSSSTNSNTWIYTLPYEHTVYASLEDGYVFDGWFDNRACTGTPLSQSLNYTFSRGTDKGAVNLYAKFSSKKIKITLNPAKSGKTVVDAGTTAIYFYYNLDGKFYSDEACTNQITTINVPKINGYSFMWYKGYNMSTGTGDYTYIHGDYGNYTAGTIESSMYVEIYEDQTFEATYDANRIFIYLDASNGDKTLSERGTTEIYYYFDTAVYYLDESCTEQVSLVTLPTLNGYTFQYYYGNGTSGGDSGERYIYGNQSGVTPGAIASDLCTDIYEDAVLYPVWTANKIKITLDPSYYDFALTATGTTQFWYYFDTNVYYSNEVCTTQITSITLPQIPKYTFMYYYGDGTCGGDSGERYVYGYQEDGTTPGVIASDLCTDIYKDATLKALFESNNRKFPETWKSELSSTNYMTTTVQASDLTSIIFAFDIPTNYTRIGKLSTGLKVYQSTADSKAIAFVTDGIISAPTNCSDLFSGLMVLETLKLNNFKTTLVTNMAGMFSGCLVLKALDVTGFDTSSVTNMSTMFSNCSHLTKLDLSSFNTAKVTNMSYMFSDSSSLIDLILTSFVTTSVTNMASMFYYCTDLKMLNLSTFDMSNVTNSTNMFDFEPGNTIGYIKTPYNNRTALAFTTDSTLYDINTNLSVTGVLAGSTESKTYSRKVTFTIDVCGGSSITPTSYTGWYGMVYSGTLSTPSKSGYTFQGWYTEEHGGVSIGVYALRDNTIFYAHWASGSSGGGGSGSSDPTDIHGGYYYEGYRDSPAVDGPIEEGTIDDILNIFDSELSNTFTASDVTAFSIISEYEYVRYDVVQTFGTVGSFNLCQISSRESPMSTCEWHLALIAENGYIGFDQAYYNDPEFFDKLFVGLPSLEVLDLRGMCPDYCPLPFSAKNAPTNLTVIYPLNCKFGLTDSNATINTYMSNGSGGWYECRKDPGHSVSADLYNLSFGYFVQHAVALNFDISYLAFVSRCCPEQFADYHIEEDCGIVDSFGTHLYKVSPTDKFSGRFTITLPSEMYAFWNENGTIYLMENDPFDSYNSSLTCEFMDLRGIWPKDNANYNLELDMVHTEIIRPISGAISISNYNGLIYNYNGEQTESFAPAENPIVASEELELSRGRILTFSISAKDIDLYLDDKKWFDPKQKKITIKTEKDNKE